MNNIILVLLCSFVFINLNAMDEKKRQEEVGQKALELFSVQLEFEAKQEMEKGVIAQASFFTIHQNANCLKRKGIGLIKTQASACVHHHAFGLEKLKTPGLANFISYHNRSNAIIHSQKLGAMNETDIVTLAKSRLDPKYKPQACPKKSCLEEDKLGKLNFTLFDKDGDFLTSYPISYKTPTATELDDLRAYIDLSLLDFAKLRVKKNNRQQ